MQDIRMLATGAEAFELVVAALIIIVTIVALFFLYRNISYEIQETKRARAAMKERQEQAESEDSDEPVTVFDKKSAKQLGLLGMINTAIRSSKEGNLATLYFINIDDFRHIAEDRPQKDIDKVVVEIDRRLKKYGGKDAIAGHLESDIFLFYYTGMIDAEGIDRIGKELMATISEPYKGVEQTVTASMGVVVFPYDGINAEQLYKNAEIALYVAKKGGKNRMHMYSEDLIETEQNNANYYAEIKKSIQNDEFLLYYQTVVDIKTGKIIGLESLLRWKHPTKGILPPGKFLNVMELTGDITWFGTWGFEKNVLQYKNWRAKTRVGDLFISTNLSP